MQKAAGAGCGEGNQIVDLKQGVRPARHEHIPNEQQSAIWDVIIQNLSECDLCTYKLTKTKPIAPTKEDTVRSPYTLTVLRSRYNPPVSSQYIKGL